MVEAFPLRFLLTDSHMRVLVNNYLGSGPVDPMLCDGKDWCDSEECLQLSGFKYIYYAQGDSHYGNYLVDCRNDRTFYFTVFIE